MFSSAPNLCLLRTIALGSEAADESCARRSNNTFVSSVASAVFWPHESDTGAAPNGLERDTDADAGVATTAGKPGIRTLRGELFVPKGSKQSFTFPRFACSVSCSFLLFFFCKICLGIVAQAETKQTNSIPSPFYRPKWLVSFSVRQRIPFSLKVSP
jgi:hypothetical protein